LREQLRARGISIDDRTKMWNAEDGRKGMIGAAAPVTDGIADAELNKLLDEREAARRVKDYNEADRVRCALTAAPTRMAPCRALIHSPPPADPRRAQAKGRHAGRPHSRLAVYRRSARHDWRRRNGRGHGRREHGSQASISLWQNILLQLADQYTCLLRSLLRIPRRVCSRTPRPGSICSRSGSVLAAALGPPAARVCSVLHPQLFDQEMQTAAVADGSTRP
jgi:hypothetical protein